MDARLIVGTPLTRLLAMRREGLNASQDTVIPPTFSTHSTSTHSYTHTHPSPNPNPNPNPNPHHAPPSFHESSVSLPRTLSYSAPGPEPSAPPPTPPRQEVPEVVEVQRQLVEALEMLQTTRREAMEAMGAAVSALERAEAAEAGLEAERRKNKGLEEQVEAYRELVGGLRAKNKIMAEMVASFESAVDEAEAEVEDRVRGLESVIRDQEGKIKELERVVGQGKEREVELRERMGALEAYAVLGAELENEINTVLRT